jgi:hypothetical protein
LPETPEAVALALLEKVAGTENWGATSANPNWRAPGVDRAKILDTYAECLAAVRAQRHSNEDLIDPSLRPGS